MDDVNVTIEPTNARLDYLMSTNIAPTNLEFHNIKDAICQDEKVVSGLDEEIAVLTERRNIRNRRLQVWRFITSPIRQLLPELVAEILLYFAHDLRMRSTCMQICRAWREIALTTPKLWCFIVLHNLSSRQFDEGMKSLNLWCMRAGTLRLSADISSFYCSKGLNPLATLIPHASRIQVLSLVLPADCFQLLFSLPEGSWPVLETLDFRILTAPSGDDISCSITVFESSSRLRTASISALDTHSPTPMTISLPSQLTSLTLDGLSPADCHGVLSMCSNLEHLELTIGSQVTGFILPNHHTLHSRLRSGKVYIGYHNFDVFNYVTAPALVTLDIRTRFGSRIGGPWFRSFATFLARSACSLQHLSVTEANMTSYEFLCCLRALPSLHTIEINQVRVLDVSVLEALSGRAQEILVPNLRRFVAVSCEAADFEVILLADMIESRWTLDTEPFEDNVPQCPVSRIECVMIYVHADAMAEDGRFEQLRNEGLDLELTSDIEGRRKIQLNLAARYSARGIRSG